MKKRILVAVLATVLAVSACGTNTKNNKVENTNTTVEETTTTAGENRVEVVENACNTIIANGGKERVELPVVELSRIRVDRLSDDQSQMLSRVQQDYIVLTGEGFDDVKESIDQRMNPDEAYMEREADRLIDVAARHKSGWLDASDVYTLQFMDENIISFEEHILEYEDDVMGNFTIQGLTFDMKTGERLDFTELGVNEELFLKKYQEYLKEHFRKYRLSVNDCSEYKEAFESTSGPEYWFLTASGIQINFFPSSSDVPSAIIMLGEGSTSVVVPYEYLKDVMKPEYCGMQGSGISSIPAYEPARIDNDTFVIKKLEDSDGRAFCLNDVEIKMPKIEWTWDSYLVVQPNGQVYVLCSYGFEDGSDETKVFEIKDGQLIEKQTLPGELTSDNIGTNDICISQEVWMLGNRWTKVHYTMGSDGTYTVKDERYEFDDLKPSTAMVVKKALPVEVNGAKTTLSVGTVIYVSATDDKGITWFVTRDQKTSGEIHYEKDETKGILTINGVSEYDYFEENKYVDWKYPKN